MDVIHTGSPAIRLLIEDASQVGHARRQVLRMAEGLGFSEVEAGNTALAATELASNLLKHAGRGVMYLTHVPGRSGSGIELTTVDQGPGFDFHQCLVDGYSTGGTQGIGLGGVARQSQLLDAWSDDKGSVVVTRIYAQAKAEEDLRLGAVQLSLASEPLCGDGWSIALRGSDLSILLVDGLGHGPLAHEAAHAATSAFASAAFGDQQLVIAQLHQAMGKTRGGAVALARVNLQEQALSFLGIGNISGTTVSDEGSRGLASMPGIVGGAFRRPQVFQSKVAKKVLILHSDGLSTRWNLRDYPGLLRRHPAVIAWVLHRDACRGRDDATVLAMDLWGMS